MSYPNFKRILFAVTCLTGFYVSSGPSANAASCVGNCGVLGPDGSITASPDGSTYRYISTFGGEPGAGSIPGLANNTTGSQYTTNAFSAAAGDVLQFYFNFVTSDGGTFSDYGWAELRDASSNHVAWLFTGRTNPAGNVSPGFGMPSNDATLAPAGTAIIGGPSNPPTWSPLGGDSGRCFTTGCGYSGWIQSLYNIPNAGTYSITFGVSNWSDDGYQTGLAFDGARIAGANINPSDVPIPGALPLLLSALGAGAFLSRRKAHKI